MTMWHRPLGEMLTDVFEGVLAARTGAAGVNARSVEMRLPVEVWLREGGAEPVFIADVPVWRWRTEFDQQPGRLAITWEAGAVAP